MYPISNRKIGVFTNLKQFFKLKKVFINELKNTKKIFMIHFQVEKNIFEYIYWNILVHGH